MEEKKIRKLSLDEMDKVNGGNNTVKKCDTCGQIFLFFPD